MSKTSTKMPQLTFGNGRAVVTLRTGKRGRLELRGGATFSLPAFRQFLAQATWFADEMARTTDPSKTDVLLRQIPLFGPSEPMSALDVHDARD